MAIKAWRFAIWQGKNSGAGASIAGEQGVLQQQVELEQSCCGSGEQGVLQQQEELAAGRDKSGTHLSN